MKFFLLALLGLAYLVSPYDFLPDMFLGPGWLDDLAVLGLLWWYFYRRGRQPAKADNRDTSGEGETGSQSNKRKTGGDHARPGGSGLSEDPYRILGVDRNASPQEIKKAYRELVNKYHPDKVSHLGQEFRELAETRFKEIQRAYRELQPK